MATDNQMEEPRPRKPRHRRNFQIEELPTFTKWLTPFSRSPSSNDLRSKSKRLAAYRPFKAGPIVLLDSSHQAAPVVADLSNDDRVLPLGESISTRAGCCCWRTSILSKSAPKFHLSPRKRKVAANASGEEMAVAVGDVLDKDGCGCRCLPTFHTCGRRKNMVVVTSDLRKEEGVVADVPNLRKEEVPNAGPDLVTEGKPIVTSDLRKDGSGCCGQWECLPAFQICRRRKVVADKEEVIVDVPKVEEVANDAVNMKEDDSGGCLQIFHISAGRKRVEDNSNTFEKDVAASNDSSNVDVPDLHKEGNGCSCFRCVPIFQIYRRRRNVDSDVPSPDKEEKVVVGVSNLPEQGVVTADEKRQSKSAQGGNCWPFRINCARGWLPRFFLCGKKMVVDASNHQEENGKPPPDVSKEEKVVVIPDSHKENIAVADGIPDHRKEK